MPRELLRSVEVLYATPTLYFVVEDGRILNSTNSGAHTTDSQIRPLGSVLLDGEFQPTGGDYRYRLDTGGLNKPGYVKHGKWLLGLMNEAADSPVSLTARLLNKAHYMGVGLSVEKIASQKRFGSLFDYYKAVGSQTNYERGVYDAWSTDQFADYVEELFVSKPDGVELREFITERARSKEGPSKHIIAAHSDCTLYELLDMRGYPDFRRYTRDDYLEWGALFMLANDGHVPRFRQERIRGLAQRRGPVWSTIINRVGSVAAFQNESAEKYAEVVAELELQAQALLDTLPNTNGISLMRDSLKMTESPVDRLRILAQYAVIGKIRLPISEERRQVLALRLNPHVLATLIRDKYFVDIEQIKAVAESMGLYHAIWGLYDRLSVLKESKY